MLLLPRHTPTALVLTRQNLEPMAGSSREALKGGYIIDDCEGTPELILIASGSEVASGGSCKRDSGSRRSESPRCLHAVYGSVRGAERRSTRSPYFREKYAAV